MPECCLNSTASQQQITLHHLHIHFTQCLVTLHTTLTLLAMKNSFILVQRYKHVIKQPTVHRSHQSWRHQVNHKAKENLM